jgi:hypothetical protein
MRTNKVAFLHFRHLKWHVVGFEPKGGITIAYELVPLNEKEVEVKFNYSVCSYKDHYNRKIGNAVSAGRLATKGPVTVYSFQKDSWFDDFEDHLLAIFDDFDLENTSRTKANKVG